MDIEKLIEQLNRYFEGETLPRGTALDAATALSTLQAENEKLRADLEYEREHANAYYEECGQWEAENEKLRAELERVKRERDAAVASWRGFCAKCAWNGKQYLADGKMDDRCKTCRENGKCNWQWRGQKEDGNG